jgi:nucleotide-binding universal stress UspA family protein
MNEFKRILVAIDYSDVSVNALHLANNLVKRLQAKLDIVHVVPVQTTAVPTDLGVIYTEELPHRDLREERDELKQFVQKHLGEDVDAECHVHSGDPVIRINQTVEETAADMIVTGTHGRTGLKHLLVGSVAESILREANVPVMCIRSE